MNRGHLTRPVQTTVGLYVAGTPVTVVRTSDGISDCLMPRTERGNPIVMTIPHNAIQEH